jgi:hypothetical protein
VGGCNLLDQFCFVHVLFSSSPDIRADGIVGQA